MISTTTLEMARSLEGASAALIERIRIAIHSFYAALADHGRASWRVI
jgi:hypothetical protein